MILEQDLTEQIIGALIEVHKYWGPGFYEELYERSLLKELDLRGISHRSQISIPLIYKGERVGDDLRLDVWVEEKVVVEMKSVKELVPVHEAQLLTYMRLTGSRVGLLVNFNVPVLKSGLKRMVI